MEPEQSESVTTTVEETVPAEQSQPEVKQHKKNPKRVEAGKKLAEHNKKMKEQMLEAIALAKAKASEVDNALQSYREASNREQQISKSTSHNWTYGLVISGALVLVGLCFWASKEKPLANPTPKPTPKPVTKPVVIKDTSLDDDMFLI